MRPPTVTRLHRSRGAVRPSSEWVSCPSKIRGRRESRVLDVPAASRANDREAHEPVTTGSPQHSGFPCTMVYGLFRALPGDRACLPPSLAGYPANLTPASGRQDHTALPSASLCRRRSTLPASIASRANVRDDHDTPLWESARRRAYRIDLGQARSGIFLQAGLDSFSLICPSGSQRPLPSSSAKAFAKAGDPVPRSLSVRSRTPRNTGSPAFAGDDGCSVWLAGWLAGTSAGSAGVFVGRARRRFVRGPISSIAFLAWKRLP